MQVIKTLSTAGFTVKMIRPTPESFRIQLHDSVDDEHLGDLKDITSAIKKRNLKVEERKRLEQQP